METDKFKQVANTVLPIVLAAPVVAGINCIGEAVKIGVREITTSMSDQLCANTLCSKLMIDAVPDFPQGYFAAASMYALSSLFTGNERYRELFTLIATPAGLIATELTGAVYWPDLVIETAGLLAFMLTLRAIEKHNQPNQI